MLKVFFILSAGFRLIQVNNLEGFKLLLILGRIKSKLHIWGSIDNQTIFFQNGSLEPKAWNLINK